MAFDPDRYLAQKTGGAKGFDPDAYLAKKTSGEGDRPWYSVTGKGLLQSLKNFGDQAETGLRSFNEMITLGASEPITSGANAAIRSATEGKSFSKAYKDDVERRRRLKEENPVANVVGGVGGALMPVGPAAAVAKGAGKVVQKGVGLVGKSKPIQGLLATKAAPVARYAGDVASGAALGAGTAAALTAPQKLIEEQAGFLKPGESPSIGEMAVGGGLLGGGIAAATPVITKGLPWAGKRLMSATLGPKVDDIDYYLKNAKDVNSAKSVEELKGKVDDIVGGLRKEVEAGNLSVQEAKEALKEIQAQAADNVRQSKFDFQVTKTEIKQSFKEATDRLEKEFGQKVSELKAVKPPTSLAPEANLAVSDLKQKVIKGSGDALETLKGGPDVELTKPYEVINEAIERLNIGGVGPVTNQARAAQKELESLKLALGNLPVKMKPEHAKKLIQQIDRSEKAIYNSGEFSDDVGAAFKQLRRAVDEQLKSQNPAYAKAMEGVARDAALHEEALSAFGDERAVFSKLNRIGSPAAEPDRGLLRKVGHATGRNFDEPIDQYLSAQRTLKSPEELERIRQGLPVYKEVESGRKMLQSMEGPSAQAEFVQKNLEGSGLLKRHDKADRLLFQNQSKLAQAEGKLKPFANITEGTSESKIRGLLNNRNQNQVELRKQFQELSKLSDTDFLKAIEDLRVKGAFEATNKSGSRNVNIWTIMGHAAAGATGGAMVGGAGGAAVGAVSGALVDQFGPAMAKKILDGVLKIKGVPTVAKIQALNIPPQGKVYLISELQRSQGAARLPRSAGQEQEQPKVGTFGE